MADDVVVKIGGDASGYEKALKDITKLSAVAFAGLTAEVGFAVAAYAEAEEASNKLSNALQNQGIYSDELANSYKQQASDLQDLTGVSDEAIVTGQALLQTMIGQQKITDEMSAAAVDLAVATGTDVTGAFEALGKAIQGNTRSLKQYGVVIEEGLSPQERQAQILEQLTQRFGGAGKAAMDGLGSIKGLRNAFDEFQETLGKEFAPLIVQATKFLTNLINTAKNNEAFIKIAAHIVGIGIAITGAITGIYAFVKAMEIARVATTALGLSVKGLVAATGLGLLLILGTELYLNWATLWPKMQVVFQAFAKNISDLAGGLGNLLLGVFTLSPSRIKEGLAEIKEALKRGIEDVTKNMPAATLPTATGQTQDPGRAALAERVNAETRRQQQAQTAIIMQEQEIRRQKLLEASDQELAIEQQKLEILKALEEEKSADMRDLYEQRYEELVLMQDEQHAADVERRLVFEEELLAQNEEFKAMSDEQKKMFVEENRAAIEAQLKTEAEVRRAAASKQLQDEAKVRTQRIADEIKFGAAYATINQMMHSEIYRGSKQAFGELAQLTQSSNETLKGIGKVAAIANIVIKTAESAMSIYAGFSTIPIIGPALGIAGAAAAVAFGAEQIGRVNGAQDGGMVEGGIRGRDSVPFLLEPGELVVPRRNFSEVINAVANERVRAGQTDNQAASGVSGDQIVTVAIALEGDEAERVITARQVEARALGTLREA